MINLNYSLLFCLFIIIVQLTWHKRLDFSFDPYSISFKLPMMVNRPHLGPNSNRTMISSTNFTVQTSNSMKHGQNQGNHVKLDKSNQCFFVLLLSHLLLFSLFYFLYVEQVGTMLKFFMGRKKGLVNSWFCVFIDAQMVLTWSFMWDSMYLPT